MTPENFCYWLRGYFEIHGNRPCKDPDSRWDLNDSQIDMINKHLESVFTPTIMPSAPKTQKDFSMPSPMINCSSSSSTSKHFGGETIC